MIVLRTRHFSRIDRKMINQICEKLSKDGVEDYEVTPVIPRDVISLEIDEKGMTKIYLPKDFEYSQYEIDDYIRSLIPHYRTTTTPDYKYYVMKISGPLRVGDVVKIIEYIIEENEFCSLIDNSMEF